MQTVLGLSMTSASVGWVLLDGNGPDAAALDHDAFDLTAGAGDTGETAQHTAAVRGAQSIATASGHEVSSVWVTWTEDIDADAKTFVKSLADLGFDNVLTLPLSKAGQAWGLEAGRDSEHTKTGICILEPGAATVMIVATGAGTVRTAVTENRDGADDLIDWLRTVFREDGWLPESLYLVGSRRDLDEVAEPIADALPIPVLDTVDAQLALARGAALASATHLDAGTSPVVETKRDRARPVLPAKEPTDPPATNTVQMPVSAFGEPAKAVKRRERPWLVAHAKKVTISAAGLAVVGAALSLAAGSSFNGDDVSAQAADPATTDASVTSASIHPVATPVPAAPAPAAQPLAAAPPPTPPEALPPETATHAAEPLIASAPQPIAVPQHTTAPSQHATTATPPAVPVTAPAPVTPPAAAPLAAPAAVTVPPAAVPIAPPPAGAPVPPAPAAGPLAPAPAPAEPPDPPPPPDPVQTLLSPLFSALP